MKYLMMLVSLLFIISCGPKNKEVNAKESQNFKVEYKGALKNMMRKGDISEKVDLRIFENTDHFYALGAASELKGEIQIFDSQPFNTSVVDSMLTFDHTFNKKATLLVYASVPKWKSIQIPDYIISYAELENFIAITTKEHHIDMDKPFPFLIEGRPQSFDWHVINWKDGDMEHSHEKHINSGLHGTIEDRPIDMVGFYSDAHHAIFTHHTTNMHIHMKTVDHKIAGHVDDLTLGKGMILKLPDTSETTMSQEN